LTIQHGCTPKVDKERVFRSPMKRVAGLLLGPQGSAVTLTFQRPHNNSFTRLQTVLRRANVRDLRESSCVRHLCPEGAQGGLRPRSTPCSASLVDTYSEAIADCRGPLRSSVNRSDFQPSTIQARQSMSAAQDQLLAVRKSLDLLPGTGVRSQGSQLL